MSIVEEGVYSLPSAQESPLYGINAPNQAKNFKKQLNAIFNYYKIKLPQ